MNYYESFQKSKKRVFISFDYDHDSDLKTLLIGQSRLEDSPFEISDWSVKYELSGDWKAKVRDKIKKVNNNENFLTFTFIIYHIIESIFY